MKKIEVDGWGVKLAVLTVTAALLSGCAYQGVTENQAAANRAQPYVEGEAALAQYASSIGCESAAADTVRSSIADLQRDVRDFQAVGMYDDEQEAQERHTSLAFDFATQALKKECLNDADRVYRGLISFYAGLAYSGIRDRAKLGIEDVRAAKSTTGGPLGYSGL